MKLAVISCRTRRILFLRTVFKPMVNGIDFFLIPAVVCRAEQLCTNKRFSIWLRPIERIQDMMNETGEFMNHLRIGVVGCGHLGQAIVQSLLSHGFDKEKLLISSGSSPLTLKRLADQGLTSCLSENEKIFREADLVFITLKPQDIMRIKEAASSGKAILVSCMAGVTISLLHQILGKSVYRMMLSGPDTIKSEKGVTAMYPENHQLKQILQRMNLKYLNIRSEEELDVFTAGVCMPAAIIKSADPKQQQMAIDKVKEEYPIFPELYSWAAKVLPSFANESDKESYVNRMITKGGVTEAIVNSLSKGESLDAALKKGIKRTKEISEEIRQSVLRSCS